MNSIKHKFRTWRSWIERASALRTRSNTKAGQKADDEPTPWLTMQSRTPESSESSPTAIEAAKGRGKAAPSRWVRDEASPYGFVDDDGTMRQVENPTWRRAFSSRRSKPGQFVPANIRKTLQVRRPGDSTPRRRGSALLWQTFLAAVLVCCGLYAHQSQQPIAANVEDVMAKVFQTDYTGQVTPALERILERYHIVLPNFGATAGVRMHSPLNGPITADYSATHPEIWLQAPANAPVMAAGTGTVIKVSTLNGQGLVEIDNGAFGDTIYAGLVGITVHSQEYVYTGQIIGRLPENPDEPVLRFAMVKDGKFENPHDFIYFPENTR